MASIRTFAFSVYFWCSFLLVSSVFSSVVPGPDIVGGTDTLKSRSTNPRAGKWNTLTGEPTIYFAHRGETVILPGHTGPAYEVAAIEQAEYVEPDLIITKDGFLVCYHDVTLNRDTNIIEDHPEFDYLKTNYSGIIGDVYENIVNGIFVQNLTLAEIKTLRVKQRRNGIRPRYFDMFQIPTFQEYLDVVHRMTITLNKTIGIIPELKHTRFHNGRAGIPYLMENAFLSELESNGYPIKANSQENCTGQPNVDNPSIRRDIKCPPVIIQSFEKVTVEYLKTKTDLDLMMLVDPVFNLLTYKGLESVAQIAKWMCVWKEYIYSGIENVLEYKGKEWNKTEIEELGGFVKNNEFVDEAHRLGMKMSVFTINDSRENSSWGCAIIPGCKPENKREELFHYFQMGLDGIFVENVPESREIRMIYEYEELRDELGAGAINIVPVSALSILVIQLFSLLLRLEF